MRKFAILSAVVAALGGCAGNNPQTRDEYRKTRLDGVPLNMVDTHVANRRFEDVVNALRQKTAECFNVNVTMRRTQNGVAVMNATDEYRTTIRVVGPNAAELTTQFTTKGQTMVQKMPEGGYYHRAVDIERVSPRTTKLTYYGPSLESGKKAWSAMKEWSDGKLSACP
jgi:hypothetical protein